MTQRIEAADENLYKVTKLHRVVVTGVGVVSPLGLNMKQTWQGLVEGRSGIKNISKVLEGEELRKAYNSEIDIAGMVIGFNPDEYVPKKEIKRVHRSAQFALAASKEALTQAALVDKNPTRIGARIGTGIGGGGEIAEAAEVIRDKSDQRVSSTSIFLLLPERTVTVSSIQLDLQAEVAGSSAACATGAVAIIDATRILQMGQADGMVAGGTEASIHRVALAAFNNIHALSRRNEDSEGASRPFDKDAEGFVMGEGAGVLYLETLESALKRKANILAEVIGYANTADAYHSTAPSGIGAVRAMRLALAMAEIDPTEVDYINAHGTSTQEIGDGTELDALKEVFGDSLPGISISSTKSGTGHLLGAAGGLEAAICIEAMQRGIVPPTLNLRNPIREGLDLVPLKAKQRKVDVAMSNSFGFGGLNSVLIFRKYVN